jgi:hypothetical protein
MISCERFVFLLTSGELDESGWLTRMQAGQHRLACRHCRAFAANDRRLDDIVRAQRERWWQADEAADDGEDQPGQD